MLVYIKIHFEGDYNVVLKFIEEKEWNAKYKVVDYGTIIIQLDDSYVEELAFFKDVEVAPGTNFLSFDDSTKNEFDNSNSIGIKNEFKKTSKKNIMDSKHTLKNNNDNDVIISNISECVNDLLGEFVSTNKTFSFYMSKEYLAIIFLLICILLFLW